MRASAPVFTPDPLSLKGDHMSVCPGCGRCRQCGSPAPMPVTYPWYGQWPVTPMVPYPQQPIWVAPYTVGDVLPGNLGSITVTC